MKVQWTFRRSETRQDQSQNYLEQKLPRLRRRLSRFGSDRCRLDLTLYGHSSRNSWELRAVLTLSTGRLIAVSEKSSIEQVIDEVIDDLARQIRRHKARVRRDHLLRRRRKIRHELLSSSPFLEQDVQQQRQDDFFEMLSPLLETVRDHAAYELSLLELEELVPKAEFDVDELIDEVLLLAYDRFKLRPPDSLMEAWLLELLNERLNALISSEPPVSLTPYAEVPVSDEDEANALDLEDVNFWMSHVFERDDTVRLEELVPDEEVAVSLQGIEAEKQQKKLKELLDKLPKRQRQALMLHEASGFEIPEIANILQMPEDIVYPMIDQARSTLRRNLADLR
ncbi:HPF/RaiA family ribosome-associated protein [Bythopirellula polymerisocia]|uniref:RNA polymerase sigma factor n=1 Tax=Bythopirellula polymerisocia TaxID=2528003 RepID=A0A5C6CVV5_9BACT|nr:sigma factor-like helix-turn-helix DNA-binding protein [Bythopirellula polymerisocia]TWU27637.1 RNA polymerase sigma factor [Bythopirellula polymerisocia]